MCVWRQEFHRAETRGIEHFDLAEIDHMGEAEARELDGLLRFDREHFAEDEKSRLRLVLAGDAPSDITTTVALTASDTAKAFQRAGEHTLKFRSAGRADYYGVGIESGREIGEA